MFQTLREISKKKKAISCYVSRSTRNLDNYTILLDQISLISFLFLLQENMLY